MGKPTVYSKEGVIIGIEIGYIPNGTTGSGRTIYHFKDGSKIQMGPLIFLQLGARYYLEYTSYEFITVKLIEGF